MVLKRPNDFILFALVCYIVAMSALVLFLTFEKIQSSYFPSTDSVPMSAPSP